MYSGPLGDHATLTDLIGETGVRALLDGHGNSACFFPVDLYPFITFDYAQESSSKEFKLTPIVLVLRPLKNVFDGLGQL